MEEEDWMSTIFLAMDKSFSFQPASFFLTLSRTKEKSCLRLPGCLNGKPKYLPKLEVGVNPRRLDKASLWSKSTFGEKNTWDFVALIIWLDLARKSLSTSLMAKQFPGLACAKRTRSFAKKKWEKGSPFLEVLIGVQLFHTLQLYQMA